MDTLDAVRGALEWGATFKATKLNYFMNDVEKLVEHLNHNRVGHLAVLPPDAKGMYISYLKR